MVYILEISQQGSLQIPSELLPQLKPHTHYQLEVQGDTLILRPHEEQPFWATATPAQRAARFRDWAQQTERPAAPVLTDDSLSRETIYD
ncbi:MAG: hypothetical protein KDJ97_17220 [Anaerolineae bacterium]|nr:hypothetical protein [Anaerolineae bacterium]